MNRRLLENKEGTPETLKEAIELGIRMAGKDDPAGDILKHVRDLAAQKATPELFEVPEVLEFWLRLFPEERK